MTQQRAPAGRPRKFDTDEALDRALDLFWQRGFRNTSTRDLEGELGITQSSLYNAFGSKHELLIAAIDRYERQVENELLARLDHPDGFLALDDFLVALGRWINTHEHRGCLVVNLMASESHDARIEQRVIDYRRKIRNKLTEALSRIPGIEPAVQHERAELLLAAVLGLHITARSSRDSEEADAMIGGLRREVMVWREVAPTDRLRD